MSDRAADDLPRVFDEATIEAYPEETLREAAMVAELAVRGYIPASMLPKLHLVFKGEIPQLVSTAMEELEDE